MSVSAEPGLEVLNSLGAAEAEARLLRCCGAPRWALLMTRMRPFHTPGALHATAADIWWALTPADWLQAFAAHPKIGSGSPAAAWSAQEQAGAAGAAEEILDELESLNAEYEARFGYIFIVCATGRSASDMLAELNRRIENAPADELRVAATEQQRITDLRLERLLTELGAIE